MKLFTVAPKVVKKESSSDSSDDSDDKPAPKKPAVKAPLTNGKVVANGKSSSSEDSSDSEDEVAAKKPKLNQSANQSAAKKKESSSSDSSDSDDSDAKKPITKPTTKLSPTKTSTPNALKYGNFVSAGFMQPTVKKPTKGKSSSEDSSDSDEEKEEKPVVQNNVTPAGGKKRKFSASEEIETPFVKKANNTNGSFNKSSNSKPNTPFRRVKNEDVEVDTRLSNNSFDAKVSA